MSGNTEEKHTGGVCNMHCKDIKKIDRRSLISAVFILSMLVIMLFILLKNHNMEEIQELLLSLKPKWLLISIGCILLSYLCEMMCFYVITKKIYGRSSFHTSFRVTMAGAYFNSVTPFACGGEPFQVSYLMKDGVPMGSCANIIMVKSAIFQASIFLFSILSFAFNADALNRLVKRFDLFFVAGISINLLVVLFLALILINKNAARNVVDFVYKMLGKCRIIKNPDKYRKKKEEWIECFTRASSVFFHDAKVIAAAFMFQLLNLFMGYVIPYFLLISLEGRHDSFFDIVTSQAVLRQITAYIPSPGGAGATEGISYFFFRNFFVKTPVVSVILIWRLITYYFNIVFSGVYLAVIRGREQKPEIGQVSPGKAA